MAERPASLTGSDRALLVLLFIPALLAVFLFEQYLALSKREAQAEARRILTTAGDGIIEDLRPDRVLHSAFVSQFDVNLPIDTNEDARTQAASLTAALAPLLKSRDQGFRIYLFGPNQVAFSQGHPEFVPTLKRLCELMYEYRVWVAGFRGESLNRDAIQLIREGQIFVKETFGMGISLESFARGPLFDLVVSTPYSSCTRVLHLHKSLTAPMGVHIQVDEENLNHDLIPAYALKKCPKEITLAAILRADGTTETVHSLPPFLKGEAFPIPGPDQAVVTFPDGLFLKKSLGEGERVLVLGITQEDPFGLPPHWRWFLEGVFLLFSAWASQHLRAILGGTTPGTGLPQVKAAGTDPKFSSPTGIRGVSLIVQTGGWFLLIALIPFLTLFFLVLKQGLESPTSQRFLWNDRLRDRIASFDDGFHQYFERCQMIPERFKPVLLQNLTRRDFSNILHHKGTIYTFFRDQQGNVHAHPKRRNIIQGKRASSLSILGYTLLKFHQYVGGWKSPAQEKDIPDPMEVAIESLLEDDSPLRDMFMNWGKIVRYSQGGLNMSSLIDILRDPAGAIRGVLFLCYFPNVINRHFWRRHQRQPRSPDGVTLYGWDREAKKLMPHENGEPPWEIRDFLEKADKHQTEMPEAVMIGSEPHLFKTFPPAFLENLVLGAIVPEARIHEASANSRRRLRAMMFAGLGVLLAAFILIRLLLIRPLLLLKGAAVEVSAGNFALTLPVEGQDEFTSLHAGFNAMTEGIRQRERMKRFVSSEVWNQTDRDGLAEEGKPRRIEGAVLFSDIRSFTTLSEQHSPEEIIAMLNGYFTAMDRVIRQNGGMIDRLIGDAIVAVFRDLPGRPHPAIRAVAAGLAMRASLSHFNRRRSQDGTFAIDNGVGIHFGTLIETRIGSREGRQDLTYFGEGIQRASELEGASKRGRATKVIVSPEVATHLGPDFPLQKLDGEGGELFEVDRLWQS